MNSNISFTGLVFIIAATRFFLWTHINPMFQGPDEVQHLAMTAQIDKNDLAVYHDSKAKTWYDFEQSFDYAGDFYKQRGVVARYNNQPHYATSGVWGLEEKTSLHRPHFDDRDGYQQIRHLTYAYPPLYYQVIAAPVGVYRSYFDATLINYQFLMRSAGFVFYGLFLVFIFLLFDEVLPRPWLYLAFGCVLFHPMLISMPAVVNNDNGLLPGTAALLYFGVKILKESRTAIFGFWLAAVALAFTKSQGILLGCIASVLISCALIYWRQYLNGLLTLLVVPVMALLFFQEQKWFGDAVLSGTSAPMPFHQYFDTFWYFLTREISRNTFGQFGWFEIDFPAGFYSAFKILFIGTMLSMLIYLCRYIKQWLHDTDVSVAAFSFFMYAGYIAAIFVYQYYLMPKVGFVIQGRYALSALPILYLSVGFLLWKAAEILPKQTPMFTGIGFALVVLLCISSHVALGLVIKRFYFAPGLGMGEVWDRMLQYKPIYFKSSGLVISVIILNISAIIGYLVQVARHSFPEERFVAAEEDPVLQ